jgi:DNA-binding protein H-NS
MGLARRWPRRIDARSSLLDGCRSERRQCRERCSSAFFGHQPTLCCVATTGARYKTMQSTNDKLELAGLSYAQLRTLLEKTEAALLEKRTEELKVLADGYAKKLAMGGFLILEGIEALRPYLPAKTPKTVSAQTSPKSPKFANPDDPSQTWVGIGKPPQWFQAQLAKGIAREVMLLN